jgi:hypothetical protein
MAALTQTAASVAPSSGAKRETRFNFGATISAGQPIYLDSSNTWQLADADVAAGAADVQAVAGNSGSAGQRCDAILEDSDFTHGLSGVAAGDTIWLYSTAGTYTKTASDVVTGFYTSVVMIATSPTKAVLRITRSGVAHA